MAPKGSEAQHKTSQRSVGATGEGRCAWAETRVHAAQLCGFTSAGPLIGKSSNHARQRAAPSGGASLASSAARQPKTCPVREPAHNLWLVPSCLALSRAAGCWQEPGPVPGPRAGATSLQLIERTTAMRTCPSRLGATSSAYRLARSSHAPQWHRPPSLGLG